MYIIFDISPSRPWLFATLHKNRELLNNRGIEFAPFFHWTCELVPSHQPYWCFGAKDSQVPAYLDSAFNEIAQHTESGKDVLLFSSSADIEEHQSFERTLKQYPALAKHNLEFLFILGRPACVLEQYFRFRESWALPLIDGPTLSAQLISLPALISDTQRRWGKNNVHLLANTSACPEAKPQDGLAKGVFDFLQCPDFQSPLHLPRHPLCLASVTARRLARALEVRENAWPVLDEALFMDCLHAAESQWGTKPISNKNIRDNLIQGGSKSLRELESMLFLEKGALDSPPWLASQPHVAGDRPLQKERVRFFAASLPREVREPLRQRFANDENMLTGDQKVMLEALSDIEQGGVAHIGEPKPPVELTVLTMTFNHEKYIAECLDSVLAQKTSFPVRHLVLDHHSSDGTAAIVAAYAAKHTSIQPVLLSQRRSHENIMGMFLRCRTKYAALCDGDDYFSDPLKLQKQVDFLESNPNCALCFHPVAVLFEGRQTSDIFPPTSALPRGVRKEYYLADLIKGNIIQTNSVVYRWRFQEGLPDWFRADLCPGDWYWHLLHAEMGKIGYIPEIMAVYRRHAKALYKDAFTNALEHRRIHGMTELDALWSINEHFHNRYFRDLSTLADGVFANFLDIYVREDNSSLMDQAGKTFPEFAKHFLNQLPAMKQLPSSITASK